MRPTGALIAAMDAGQRLAFGGQTRVRGFGNHECELTRGRLVSPCGLAFNMLELTGQMNRRNTVSRGFALAKSWLAGLLVFLMLALSVGSVLHRNHSDHQAGQHSCALCLLAHGGVMADGATGTAIISAQHSFDLPSLGETKSSSAFDLRLAPGRAPPV